MIITSQNWDGVTPPALPTGWAYDSGFATSARLGSIVPTSSPNMLVNGVVQAVVAYYQTADNAGGNVRVTSKFTGQVSGTNDPIGAVFARGSTLAPTSQRTCYEADIDFYAQTISLWRYQQSQPAYLLGTVGASLIGAYAYAAGSWFTLQLICSGTTISVNVESPDNLWLQTNGTWGATRVNCLQVTDVVVSGSGYGGLVLTNGSGDAYTDDFLFESLNDIRPTPHFVRAQLPWWLREG